MFILMGHFLRAIIGSLIYHEAMRQGITRWSVYLLALFAFGPVAGTLVAWLRAPDGGPDATPIVSTTPVLGLVAALGAILVALIPGLASAFLVDARAGMISTGLALAWPAFRSGTVDGLIRSSGSAGVFRGLMLEGLVLGLAGFASSVLLSRAGSRHEPGGDHEPRPVLAGRLTALIVAIGVPAAGIAAWAVAQEPLSGQALASAVAAGIVAGAAGHLLDHRSAIPALFVPILVLAVLGPLSGYMSGVGDLVVAGRNGQLFPTANLTALHWISGGLIGIPLGEAWAGSMLDKRVEGRASRV
jgi:hypothetical protein